MEEIELKDLNVEVPSNGTVKTEEDYDPHENRHIVGATS